MEELRQTINKVLKKVLGEKAIKIELSQHIKEFFINRGISEGEFDVDIKRKYIYIRVKNSYIRHEMSLMSYELMEYLKKGDAKISGYEIRFTGRI